MHKLIKEIRLKCRMTQDEVAEKAKVSKSFISQLENGKTNASLETLTRICNVFNLTITEFFSLLDEKNKPRLDLPLRYKELAELYAELYHESRQSLTSVSKSKSSSIIAPDRLLCDVLNEIISCTIDDNSSSILEYNRTQAKNNLQYQLKALKRYIKE